MDIYQHLLSINAGYEQVIRSLAALRNYGVFHAGELARFSALSKETRAATNSYLVGAMEIAERRLKPAGGSPNDWRNKDWTKRGIDIVIIVFRSAATAPAGYQLFNLPSA